MVGIVNAEDAVEFMISGAAAVQVGTAHFRNPRACIDIVEGLEAYLEQHKLGSVKELIGALKIDLN